MPCLVKCYPGGISENGVIVSSTSGNFPSNKGFIPSEGDRVFLWAIEEHGGNGLRQRGHIDGFHKVEKTFRFQVRGAEHPIQAFRGSNLGYRATAGDLEKSIKDIINGYRPPCIRTITEEQAVYLDQFYPSLLAHAANGFASNATRDLDAADLADDLEELRSDLSVNETTRAQLIQARLGQGQFRQDVLRRWQGACAVTGCSQLEVLRASHIRPWRDSSHEERLNPANGILLTANLDALFDRCLISFANNGEMLISGRVEQSCRESFGLPIRMRGELTAEEKGFLGYHRDQFQEEE